MFDPEMTLNLNKNPGPHTEDETISALKSNLGPEYLSSQRFFYRLLLRGDNVYYGCNSKTANTPQHPSCDQTLKELTRKDDYIGLGFLDVA